MFYLQYTLSLIPSDRLLGKSSLETHKLPGEIVKLTLPGLGAPDCIAKPNAQLSHFNTPQSSHQYVTHLTCAHVTDVRLMYV